jgi:hypothetical protein
MSDSCGCGHCHCDNDNPPAGGEKTPEEKLEALKKDISDLGFHVEETSTGDIKITRK